jgi:hypothetical protein
MKLGENINKQIGGSIYESVLHSVRLRIWVLAGISIRNLPRGLIWISLGDLVDPLNNSRYGIG